MSNIINKIDSYLNEAKIAETPEEAVKMFLASNLFKKYFKKGWIVGDWSVDRYNTSMYTIDITVKGSKEEALKNKGKPKKERFSDAQKKLYEPTTTNHFVSDMYEYFRSIGWKESGEKSFSLSADDYLELSVFLTFSDYQFHL